MRLDKKSEPQHFYGFIEMEERIYFIVLLYEGWKFKLVMVLFRVGFSQYSLETKSKVFL